MTVSSWVNVCGSKPGTKSLSTEPTSVTGLTVSAFCVCRVVLVVGALANDFLRLTGRRRSGSSVDARFVDCLVEQGFVGFTGVVGAGGVLVL